MSPVDPPTDAPRRLSRSRLVAAVALGFAVGGGAGSQVGWELQPEPTVTQLQAAALDVLGRQVEQPEVQTVDDLAGLGPVEARGGTRTPIDVPLDTALDRARAAGYDAEVVDGAEDGERVLVALRGDVHVEYDTSRFRIRGPAAPWGLRAWHAAGALLAGAATGAVSLARQRAELRRGRTGLRRARSAFLGVLALPPALFGVVYLLAPSALFTRPDTQLSYDLAGVGLVWLVFGWFLWVPVGCGAALAVVLLRHRRRSPRPG